MYRYEEQLKVYFAEHYQELVDLMCTICLIPAPSHKEEKRAAYIKGPVRNRKDPVSPFCLQRNTDPLKKGDGVPSIEP